MSRVIQIVTFLGVASLLIGGIHYYFYCRLIRDVSLPSSVRPWALLLLVVLAASMPLTFLFMRLLPLSVAQVVLFVPYLWMGMMLLLFFFLVGVDCIRLLAWIGYKITGLGQLLFSVENRVPVARWIASLALGTVGVLTIVSTINGLRSPVVRSIDVNLSRLPKSLDSFSLVQLTDLHLGPTLGKAWLQKVVDQTNDLHPDLVVITGDLVDADVEKLRETLSPLTRLNAPHGVFFVTGNHEFYMGVDQWLLELSQMGIQVLDNQNAWIKKNGEGFYLVGIHDLQAARMVPKLAPDLAKAMVGILADQESILLSHQAKTVFEAENLGIGMQLSGHNHAGQIWPWSYFVLLQQPFIEGLHRVGKTILYISQGTGFWGPPMRLGTRAEITQIKLHSFSTRKKGKEEL